MKWKIKIFLIGVAIALILCNFVIASDTKDSVRKITLSFQPPTLYEENGFLSFNIENESTFRVEPGYPLLPEHVVTLDFPLSTLIDDIVLHDVVIEEITIDKKIMPSPQPIPLGHQEIASSAPLNNAVYENSDPYPDTWFTHTLGGGLKNGNRCTLLSIHLSPVKYFPALDTIQYIREVTLTISYTLQDHIASSGTSDPKLVIITPLYYYIQFLDLMEHKNSLGLPTTIVTLDEIYDGTYFPVEGRDDQEKIKYFIKNAIEQWNTFYILLGGGYRDIPIRYSYVPTFLPPEEYFPSDLYYADIYDADGHFSSWDTNNNDIFGEYHYQNRTDTLDLYPDVYLGRIACDSVGQAATVVDKIITYENHSYGRLWFKNIIVCAGDTFPGDQERVNEGEFATGHVVNSMSDFTPTKLWVSLSNLDKKNIRTAINYGAGFVDFSGHGTDTYWKTYLHGDVSQEVDFDIQDVSLLSNREKLPIFTINACLCGKFDQGNCFAWHLVKQADGGGIATISYSGIAYGIEGSSQIERWSGWIETHFYDYYKEIQTNYNLGLIWEKTLREYINRFKTSDADYKTVEEWTLFGDPSLTIGGYHNPDEILFQIGKPTPGHLYRKDKEILPTLFGNTIIFGDITVKISSSETLERVEFYVDDSLKFTDTTPPYEWTWDEQALFLYKLRIIGYTNEGDMLIDSLDVRIFNLS